MKYPDLELQTSTTAYLCKLIATTIQLYVNRIYELVHNIMFKNLVISLIFTAGVFLPSFSDESVATPLLKVQNPLPYPAADKNGDYQIINGNSGVMPFVWEVVDPEGLNVRCQNRTNQTNRIDMIDLPVDSIMPIGERFEAVGIFLDDGENLGYG